MRTANGTFACVPIEDRFWKLVEVSTDAECCWPWIGRKNKDGYGVVIDGPSGKTSYAHRVAYRLGNGSLDADDKVRHRCDNPPCCNPGHLIKGTQADNLNDMKIRNRGRKTEISKDVISRIKTDNRSQRQIAKDYGLNQATVSRIKKGFGSYA